MRACILILSLLLAALGIAGYVARTAPQPEDDDFGVVGDFTLTERGGAPVDRSALLGKVWVASFVFTCCTTSCPQVSGTMAQLNTELADDDDFRLVTFTVDPERDTPAVLKNYASRYGADSQRWLFLTGEQRALYELIEKSFLLAVQQNEGPNRTPGNEVTHSSRLVLVDRRGHIRGYFEGRRSDDQGQPLDDLPRLRRKIQELLRERGSLP